MSRRALIRDADLRRIAKVAREQRVSVCVELPDGTKLHIGMGASAPQHANGFDEALG